MTNEERQQAIEWLKRRPVMMAGAKRIYDLAVEALEAYVPDMIVGKTETSCESDTEITRCSNDTISRQAVIDLLKQMRKHGTWEGKNIFARIRKLPPARPKRKTGNWIYGEDRSGQDGWFCSECRFFVPWYYEYNKNIDFIRAYKTCSCCDAKMISYTGKDEENE